MNPSLLARAPRATAPLGRKPWVLPGRMGTATRRPCPWTRIQHHEQGWSRPSSRGLAAIPGSEFWERSGWLRLPGTAHQPGTVAAVGA